MSKRKEWRYYHPKDVLIDAICDNFAKIVTWHRRRRRLHIEKNFNERNDGDNQFVSLGTWQCKEAEIPGYVSVADVQASIALGLWMKKMDWLGCSTDRTLLMVPVWDRIEHPDKPEEEKESWRRVWFDSELLKRDRTINDDRSYARQFLESKGLGPITPDRGDLIREDIRRYWEEAGDGPPPGDGLAGGSILGGNG